MIWPSSPTASQVKSELKSRPPGKDKANNNAQEKWRKNSELRHNPMMTGICAHLPIRDRHFDGGSAACPIGHSLDAAAAC